jgi:hypothetical protein
MEEEEEGVERRQELKEVERRQEVEIEDLKPCVASYGPCNIRGLEEGLASILFIYLFPLLPYIK